MRSLKINIDKIVLGLIVSFPVLYYIKSFADFGGAVELHHFYDFFILGLIFISLLLYGMKKVNVIILPVFALILLSVLSFVVKGELSSGFFGYYHRWVTFLFSILFGIHLAKSESISSEELFKYLNVFVYLCLFFGILQIVIGDIPFMNGRHRLSGQYRIRPVAYSLNLFVCLIIYTIKIHKFGKGKNYHNYIVLLLILVFIYLTHTRLTLLVILTFVFLAIKVNWKYKIGLVGGFAGIAVILFLQTDVLYRFELLFAQFGSLGEYAGDGSLLLRVQVTTFMLGKLAENWILGIGPGMFNQVWEDSFGEAGMSPHFGILTILVENGLLGTLILLLFLALLFYTIYSNRFKNPYLAKVFSVGIILYYIGSTFNTPLYKTELVFLLNTVLFYFAFKDLILKRNVRFRLISKEAS